MRILILSQFFDPEPTIKNLAFAKALAAAGHEVRVLTGFPNYPGGELYTGYRLKLIQRELVDGIRITRVPLYPSHSGSKFGRVANYLSFAFTASLVGVFAGWRPDVVYTYHPPLTVGLVACLMKWLRGVPFVYDVQDMWPEALSAPGMLTNPQALKAISWVGRHVYKAASLLLPQSPGMAARLREEGASDDKIRVVYNWADEKALGTLQPWTRPPELEGKFVVTFAGTMGGGQGLDAVLEAAALLKVAQPNARLLFIGGGTEKMRLQGLAQARVLDNVVFLPPVPMEQVGSVLQAADVLLVHLRDAPIYRITIPSKTQAYLFMGKPIIIGVAGDAAALVQEADAGIAVPPEDAAALADAVTRMMSLSSAERASMGARGRMFYEWKLSFAVGVRAMLDALEQAAKR